MLTDLLTSSKGPGVIGTFFALVVLIGFYGLFVLVMDGSGGPGLQADINKKERNIVSLKNEIAHWEKEAVRYKEHRKQNDQLETLQSKLNSQLNKIRTNEKEVEAIRGKLVSVQNQFENHKKQYRAQVRAKAVGEKIEELRTGEGKVYYNVKIRKVDAIGMNIQHRDGFTRIDYKHMPQELQKRFQFSKEEANELSKKEEINVVRSVQGGEHYKVARKILDLKTKILAASQKITQLESDVRRDQTQILANTKKISAARSEASRYRAMGNRGLNWDTAKKHERRADSLGRQNTRLQSEISAKRALITRTQQLSLKYQSDQRNLERELKALKEKKQP